MIVQLSQWCQVQKEVLIKSINVGQGNLMLLYSADEEKLTLCFLWYFGFFESFTDNYIKLKANTFYREEIDTKHNLHKINQERREEKKFRPFLDLCVSSLRRGHANLLCIVPILSDVPEGTHIGVVGAFININGLVGLYGVGLQRKLYILLAEGK